MWLRRMYRSISGGPGQGPGLVNWLANDTMQMKELLIRTFAGAGHGCDVTRSVDTEPSLLQTCGRDEVQVT